MHFPTQKIGKALGVPVETPFLNEKIIQLAKKIPVNLKVKVENNKKHGKWILRKSFEEKIPKKKSPMQDGAGTRGLTDFFDRIIRDEIYSEKKKKIKEEFQITIRSKESLHYFEIFKKVHGASVEIQNTTKSCPFCHFKTESSKFCRMCGAFPI
jgi:asparagine synthase (glutamine-hydrolysing)